jgi:hypothetical protein
MRLGWHRKPQKNYGKRKAALTRPTNRFRVDGSLKFLSRFIARTQFSKNRVLTIAILFL